MTASVLNLMIPMIDMPATSFAVTLKAWHAKPGRSRKWAAAALGVPIANYNRYCNGGGCQQEATLRKLMQMIDDAEIAEATACASAAALPARS